jgi:ABC-type dipeptide/oligopeptide/nickel transport system permease component
MSQEGRAKGKAVEFLRYLAGRLLMIPLTMLIITAVLYGFIMLTPAVTRAELYMPSRLPSNVTPERYQRMIEIRIEMYHLNDPYPIQYALWLKSLVQGEWGYSPTLGEDVLPSLLRRTPATLELTLYSLLFFIPLGLFSGGWAAWQQGRKVDRTFRLAAFTATSLPTFISALVLMAIFYVVLHWFPPERLSLSYSQVIYEKSWNSYTGLLTLDGLLNRRLDITLDALRHLVLPVITLSMAHWATLGRITRALMIEELQKDYIVAAKARGVPNRGLVWGHAFRNTTAPALASSALSAATLFTGVMVVEIIFGFKGVSELLLSVSGTADAAPVLGFGVYSVLVVLLIMFGLDVAQGLLDPRIREQKEIHARA